METSLDGYGPQPPLSPPPRRWPRVAASVLMAAILFGAGWAVGHGSNSHSTASNKLDYSGVNRLYDLLRQDFDGSLDNQALVDGLKHGLVDAAGDPYTTFFNSQEAQDFEDQLSGSFSGIGAELGSRHNHIVIISPLSGYPAAKAGLKPQDQIAAINGKPTIGMSIDAAVAKIRGPAGTKVKLTVIRGSGQPFNLSIVRQKITVASVKSNMIGSIGYLKVSQFSADTVSLAQQAARKFQAAGAKAVILDLRGDPGGFLDAAVDVSSLWLDSGKTVVSERRNGQVENTETARGNSLLKGLPTIVLIDGGSASASEITAGALHDNQAAQLLGETSFGKGSVQKVECLDQTATNDSGCSGAELKVTVAHWYTPNGVNINKHGIKPDIVVKLSNADAEAGRDPQKAKALELLKQKIH